MQIDKGNELPDLIRLCVSIMPWLHHHRFHEAGVLVDPVTASVPIQHEPHGFHGLAEIRKPGIARMTQDGL